MEKVHNSYVISLYYKQDPDSDVWSFRCTDKNGEYVPGDRIKEEAWELLKKMNPDK